MVTPRTRSGLVGAGERRLIPAPYGARTDAWPGERRPRELMEWGFRSSGR